MSIVAVMLSMTYIDQNQKGRPLYIMIWYKKRVRKAEGILVQQDKNSLTVAAYLVLIIAW